jgi:hypothetical protein
MNDDDMTMKREEEKEEKERSKGGLYSSLISPETSSLRHWGNRPPAFRGLRMTIPE